MLPYAVLDGEGEVYVRVGKSFFGWSTNLLAGGGIVVRAP